MSETVPETVPERLKRLRLERGLSQRGLACPGVSYAYISRIEAGTRTPSVKALRRLAERLDVSAEYLETGEERTLTDDLLDRLVESSGSGLSVGLQALPTPGVSVEWRHGTELRACAGATLTDALRAAVGYQAELARIRLERERLDAEEREALSKTAA